MKPTHILLALLVAAVWGVNFVVIRVGLDAFPPLLLAALRFALACLPALWLPRPAVSWPRLLTLGLAWFVGQFGLLFTGMAVGMPPGLASVTLQSQAFFTVLLSAFALRERPSPRQLTGTAAALAGLALIGSTAGTGGTTTLGVLLTIGAALCWACGNILMRGVGKVDMLPLVAWLSLVPPLPLLALSLALDGPQRVTAALAHFGWSGAGALLYITGLATFFGFGVWGRLLKTYPASTVAPFSLLVPVFGASAAYLVYGEQFGGARLAGMGLIMLGLAVAVWPTGGWRRAGRATGKAGAPGLR